MEWLPPSGADTYVIEQSAVHRAHRSMALLVVVAAILAIVSNMATATAYVAAILVVFRLFAPFRRPEAIWLRKLDWYRQLYRAGIASSILGAIGAAMIMAAGPTGHQIMARVGMTGLLTALLIPGATVYVMHRMMSDRSTVMLPAGARQMVIVA